MFVAPPPEVTLAQIEAAQERASLRTLHQVVSRVASKQSVKRSVHGQPTYQLQGRRGLRVEATLYDSGEEVASFTRETHTGEREVVAQVGGAAAQQIFRDLRGAYRAARTGPRMRSIKVEAQPALALGLTQPKPGPQLLAAAREFGS